MIELAALQVQVVVLRQLAIIRRELGDIHERLEIMSEQQTHLDGDVQALTDAASSLEAEVANLKDQLANGVPPEQINFTGLDNVVARLKGDEPAPVPAPAPAPADGGAPAPVDTPAAPADTTTSGNEIPAPVDPNAPSA